MKIWILGQSMSLPFDLKESQGWPYLLSKELNIPYQNLAQPAVDNLFIYSCFLEIVDLIQPDDLLIVGWSHRSRKTFVFDCANSAHTNALNYSLHYKTLAREFIRSRVARPNNKKKWSNMVPNNTGLEFYDRWFDDYYSEHEQICNFQSYLDSVQHRCVGHYIPFFFSKESVHDLSFTTNNAGYMLDFIIENHVQINEDNLHLNPEGHRLWTKHLINCIDTDLNNPYNSNKTGHPRPYNSEKIK